MLITMLIKIVIMVSVFRICYSIFNRYAEKFNRYKYK